MPRDVPATKYSKNNGERRSSFLLAQQQRRITDGVEFDTIAREWRCQWEEDDVGGKASLVSAQVALESVLDDLKAVDGVKSVERVVCGGCFDFKVITSLDADKFDAWEENELDPEVYFLEMLGDIDGISSSESTV
jgi:hypothetical protein